MKTIFGWFFYFSIALNVDSENLSAKGLVSQFQAFSDFKLHLNRKDLKVLHFFHIAYSITSLGFFRFLTALE